MTALESVGPTVDNYLEDRGFPTDAIAEAGWRIEALGKRRCRLYGLRPRDAADSPVWVIPYRHSNGRTKFERIRFIEPADVERFHKYRQPAGRSLELYDPLGVLEREPLDSVLLVEGEANAVAAHVALAGLPIIGLPGQSALKEEMARQLGHIQYVWLWIDQHDPGAAANAARISKLLRQAGVEEVRQIVGASGMDANEALQALGAERFATELREMLDRAPVLGTIMDSAEEWPDLGRPQLPSFPLDALPEDVARFVQAVAHETQTPVDLAALDALGVLAAAAQSGAVVDCGAWEEELTLYLLVAMPSGEHKSAVLRAVLHPFREIERELVDSAAGTVRDQGLRLEQLQVKRSRLIKKAGEAELDEERQEAELELEEVVRKIEDIGNPRMPRLLADDATPEALASLLSNHRSIAIIAAEAPIIDNIVGRYDAKGNANLALFCRGYTGEEMRVDRRGRDSELLERPLITTLLTVQPHILSRFVEHDTARNQGLVGRFAYAMPESSLGSRQIVGVQRVNDELRSAWSAVVRKVYSVRQLTQLTQPSEEASSVSSVSCHKKDVSTLSLSPSARTALDDLRQRREPRLAAGGDLRDVSDWISREAGRAARIAALLHLAERSAHEPISEETMRRALRISDYLTAHSVAALTAPDEKARRALKVLARRDESIISTRDLHREVLNSKGKAQDAQRLADTLVELGALRESPMVPSRGGGRPPSPTYEINPRLRDLG